MDLRKKVSPGSDSLARGFSRSDGMVSIISLFILEAKMISSIGEISKVSIGRVTAGILAAALLVSGIVASSPALASTTSKPTIAFDGNTLASTTPKDEVVDRPNDDLGFVTNGPLARVASTTRPGYTFGGWSFEKGGPAITQMATAKTSDTFRVIYAVWNTTVKYNLNGADSGLSLIHI